MIKSSVILCACVGLALFSSNSVLAQDTSTTTQTKIGGGASPDMNAVNGGVLNGKAKNLAKPEYPQAAKAVRASGAVNVQVTIDENGDVISASAVSGHPLLRPASVAAARASKFTPTQINGQPVKVTGVIVYNFVAAPNVTNWFSVGMLLSTLDKMSTLRYFDAAAVTNLIPADWTAEKQQLQKIDELKKAELESGEDNYKERVIQEKTAKNEDGSIKSTTRITTGAEPSGKPVSAEHIAIAQSLIASLQGRLATDSDNLWRFKLGLNLSQALSKADAPSKEERQSAVQPFREFLETAPPAISKQTIGELQKIVLSMEKGVFSDADRIELSESFSRLHETLK